MEVMVRNFHDQVTEKEVQRFFRPVLSKLGIGTFGAQKIKGKGWAKLTVTDQRKGEALLQQHGQNMPGAKGFKQVKLKLFHQRKPLNISRSDHEPDSFLLKALTKEEADHELAPKGKRPLRAIDQPRSGQRAFPVVQLHCGLWDYYKGTLYFANHYQLAQSGRLFFGRRSVSITIHARPSASLPMQQIEMAYNSIESLTIGGQPFVTLTFCLAEAPKMFERVEPAANDLVGRFGSLQLSTGPPKIEWKRISALSPAHEVVASSCFVYRVRLPSGITNVPSVRSLQNLVDLPSIVSWNTELLQKAVPYVVEMTSLNEALAGTRYMKYSFELKFQFQRLAQNGYLPPSKVVDLMAAISRHVQDVSDKINVGALRRLYHQIPYAGPSTEHSDLDIEALADQFAVNQQTLIREESYAASMTREYEHLAPIHKAIVTPAGIVLGGPELEVKNRVLRKYTKFCSYFLQVSFLDEDLAPLQYVRSCSNKDIHHKRFKKFLEGIINIAGRGYEVSDPLWSKCSVRLPYHMLIQGQFLGFSHSSLRSYTCWFMAPFTLNGTVVFARSVIKELGNFSSIRSPARCAARIGQAFSQTFSSVKLSPRAFVKVPDIKRNGRVFSDGVGTCSLEVIHKIWKGYSPSRGKDPTLFQIRYAGTFPYGTASFSIQQTFTAWLKPFTAS